MKGPCSTICLVMSLGELFTLVLLYSIEEICMKKESLPVGENRNAADNEDTYDQYL